MSAGVRQPFVLTTHDLHSLTGVSIMSAKLSVIFYIILCLEIGIVLTLLPWIPQGTMGLSDWGNNYFLLYAARKTGSYGLQTFVASGWMRGAVTGIGLLNLGIAFWEIFHFNQTVRALQESVQPAASSSNNADLSASQRSRTAGLPDHKRADELPNNSGQ